MSSNWLRDFCYHEMHIWLQQMASNQKSDILVLSVYKQDVVNVRHPQLQ